MKGNKIYCHHPPLLSFVRITASNSIGRSVFGISQSEARAQTRALLRSSARCVFFRGNLDLCREGHTHAHTNALIHQLAAD